MRKNTRKSTTLFPDPGPLPTRASPQAGVTIRIKVAGLPPDKDETFSIRNPRHRRHQRFMDLRRAAIATMKGRKRYLGPIELNLKIYAPRLERSKAAYLGGIFDTLDGSHGFTFTYLPIVYEDDWQVFKSRIQHIVAPQASYEISVRFLKHGWKPRISKELREKLQEWNNEKVKQKKHFCPRFREDDG